MNPDIIKQGELSEEISILKRLIMAADKAGQVPLCRSLIETLSKVALNQDRRNLFYSSVIGRETALMFAVDCIQAITDALRMEEVDDDLFTKVMDRVEANMGSLKLANSTNDQKLLRE